MQRALLPARAPTDLYWRKRWLDTERELAASSNEDLRVVYKRLLDHYQRMAARYERRQSDGVTEIRYSEADLPLAVTTFSQNAC